MSSPFCHGATAGNFDALVPGNACRGPVAVYLWVAQGCTLQDADAPASSPCAG